MVAPAGDAYLRAHLGVQLVRDPDVGVFGRMPLGARARTRDGHVSLGAVATLVDVVGVLTAAARHGGRLVTSHLALRVPTAPAASEVRAFPTVARLGRAAVVSTVRLAAATDEVFGVATVTSGVLTGRGSSHAASDRGHADFFSPREIPPDDAPIDDYLGLEHIAVHRGPRRYRMPVPDKLRNGAGVVHGGAVALLVEHAALAAATDEGLLRPVAFDLDVHFLLPGLAGPLAAVVEVVGVDSIGVIDRRLAMLVAITDEGHGDRQIALGLVGVSASATT